LSEVKPYCRTFVVYFKRILLTVQQTYMKKKRIVIFASGSGTNAQNIIQHFQQSQFAEVVQVLTNKKDAKVLDRAKSLGIKGLYFTKEDLISKEGVLQTLKNIAPDVIVLAGFLLKFPEIILDAFPNKVMNIHPALLPKFGGKGMYGSHVHEAVISNKEVETGITIHFVNQDYDEGAIIFQAKTALSENETPETVAKKVHELEYAFFPQIIEETLRAQDKEQ